MMIIKHKCIKCGTANFGITGIPENRMLVELCVDRATFVDDYDGNATNIVEKCRNCGHEYVIVVLDAAWYQTTFKKKLIPPLEKKKELVMS